MNPLQHRSIATAHPGVLPEACAQIPARSLARSLAGQRRRAAMTARSLAGALAMGLGLGLASAGHAAEIYRWVDDQGRVQMSDVVPERYQKSAVRIDSHRFELTEAQRAEASRQRSRMQAQEAVADAHRAARTTPADSTERLSAERPAGVGSLSKTSSSPGEAEPECERQWREYFDSQACFAPYFTAEGVRGEAFKRCKEVENPSQRCGPAKNMPGD